MGGIIKVDLWEHEPDLDVCLQRIKRFWKWLQVVNISYGGLVSMQNSNLGDSKKARRSGALASAALLMLTLSLANDAACSAQAPAPSYQAAEPKLDNTPAESRIRRPVAGVPATLQGSVQHTGSPLQGSILKQDKKQQRSGRLMFGKSGRTDSLKAGVKDNGSALKANAEGSIGIVGVKFVATLGKPPVVNEVFPNTPADRVGMRVSDMIVAVDGVPTSGLTKDEVFDLIVGTPGTQVSLSILRNGDYQVVNCVRMDITELNDPRIRRDYMIHM